MLIRQNLYTLKEINANSQSDIRLAVIGAWQGHSNGSFSIDATDLEKMKINFDKRGIDTVIDYEHQTLSGAEAPAAGWIKELYIKEDELWGKVSWTHRAKEYIKNGEYRYLSPVYEYAKIDAKTGIWQGATLHSASLTNTPFLDELGEVIANKKNHFRKNTTHVKEKNMDNDIQKELNAQIIALKQENAELLGKAEELSAELAQAKVEAAIAANKIPANQKDWALRYCKQDAVGFDEFLKNSIPVMRQQPPADNLYANKNESTKAVFDIAAAAQGA